MEEEGVVEQEDRGPEEVEVVEGVEEEGGVD